MEDGLHLILGDVLEGWKNGILDLRLDGHFNHSCGILGQLVGNEFQKLFLTSNICRLFADTGIFQALVYKRGVSIPNPSRKIELTLLVKLLSYKPSDTAVQVLLHLPNLLRHDRTKLRFTTGGFLEASQRTLSPLSPSSRHSCPCHGHEYRRGDSSRSRISASASSAEGGVRILGPRGGMDDSVTG
jgi:hypothetical protein